MAIIGEKDIVVFSQIGKILQEHGGDVDPYFIPSYFTKEANIRMWSKFKPVWYNDLFIDIKVAYKAKYSGNEKRLPGFHSDGDCGVAPLTREVDAGTGAARGELIKNAAIGGWHYAFPMGDAYKDSYGNVACPLRVGDFRSYSTDALPPMYIPLSFQERTIELTQVQTVRFVIELENSDDYSLQAEDIASAGIVNLKRCKLVGVLYKYNGDFSAISEADDFLVDEDGLPLEQTISFSLRGFPYANGNKVYLALRYIPEDGGTIYFYPIPSMPPYTSSFPLTVNCTIIPTSTGGIADWTTDVYIAPYETSTFSNFRLFYDASEEGSARYYMTNYDGDMSLRIKLTNTGNSSTLFSRSAFKLSTSKVTGVMPTRMTDDSGNAINSVTVPAKGTVWFYLQFDNVLQFSSGVTGKYETQEISFDINDIQSFSGSLYYHYGVPGWNNL